MIKRFFKNNFNLFYSKLRFQKGFMLAEVLIVIALSLLLTLVVMVNHREGQKKAILQRAAHKLAQDIRAVQEMAVSGRKCPECGGSEPNGYGIEVRTALGNNMLYKLYADTAEPYEFYSEEDDIIIEVIQLEKDVVVKSISIWITGEDPTSPNRACLNFKPPDPLITIKSQPNETSRDIAEITLGFESGSSDTKKITVNTVGLIEIAENNPAPPPSGVCGGGGSFFGDPPGYVPCHDPNYFGGFCSEGFGICSDCSCPCSDFTCGDCAVPPCYYPQCSDLDELLCNSCGCTWWP